MLKIKKIRGNSARDILSIKSAVSLTLQGILWPINEVSSRVTLSVFERHPWLGISSS